MRAVHVSYDSQGRKGGAASAAQRRHDAALRKRYLAQSVLARDSSGTAISVLCDLPKRLHPLCSSFCDPFGCPFPVVIYRHHSPRLIDGRLTML